MATTNRYTFGNQGVQAAYDRERLHQQQIANMNASLQATGMNNPIGVLGYLIGNSMGQKVYNNGVQKGQDELDRMLGNYTKPSDYSAMNDALNSAVNVGITPASGTEIPINQNATPVGDTYTGINGTTPTLGNAENFTIPTATNSQMPDIRKFDAVKLRDELNRWGRANGKSDAQINDIWNSRKDVIEGLTKDARKARIGDFYDRYTKDGELSMSMDNADFVKQITTLAQDDPTTAALMAKLAQSKDNQNFQRKQAELKHQYNKELLANRQAGALDVARFRKENKTVRPDNTAFKNAYNYYKDITKRRDAWSKDVMNEGKAFPEEAEYQRLKNYVNGSVFGEEKSNGGNGWNDYDAVTNWVTRALGKITSVGKVSREQAIAMMRDQVKKQGGSTEFENVLGDMTEEEWKAYGL